MSHIDDLQRGERVALALVPELHSQLEHVKRPDQFWCAIIIALSAMASNDLGEEASELLHASVSVGVGDPGFRPEDDSSESEPRE